MGIHCSPLPEPRTGTVTVDHAQLFVRETGRGEPIIVLHGGPDFDHGYLLPELDRLAGRFRLIYYDQRGRGASDGGVKSSALDLESEIDDLDAIRNFFGLKTVTLLGHSWGALLALTYALHAPDRVTRLILMNTAPVSSSDFALFRESRQNNTPDDLSALRAIKDTPAFQDGDPDAVAAYYRVHFRAAFARSELLDPFISRLRAGFTRQGILRARAIEDRLVEQTWSVPGYDLLPAARTLRMPVLVLHGDHDFIPVVCAARIADALPDARLIVLPECGHFAYLEQPEQTETTINSFMKTG